jgi:hypothetical protein
MIWAMLSGFVGGILAWLATTFLAQPLQRFLQLRNDAAVAIAQFEERAWIGNPDAKPPTNEWLDRRREAYDRAGTALVALANTNRFVTRVLRHAMLGRHRCHVRSAGENLRTLGETYPGTQASDQCLRWALSALAMNNRRA